MPLKLFLTAGRGCLGSTHTGILEYFKIKNMYHLFSNVTIAFRNNPKYPLEEALGEPVTYFG